MTDEQKIEKEIQDKGLNAPRLTPDAIDAQIIEETYIRASEIPGTTSAAHGVWAHRALSCLTICVLVLRNGYTIVGKSACASPENFNQELGNKIAREDARRQIWALEGYALRNKLVA